MGQRTRQSLTNVALVLALMCGRTAAQPAEPAEATLAEILGPEGFALYDQGKAAYDVQQYDRAIAAFRQGYAKVHHPVFVFAIAKAQQRAGACRASIEALEGFVRSRPGPDWVRRATEEIATCRKLLDESERGERLRSEAAATNAVVERRRRSRHRLAIVVGGGGVVAIVAAALLRVEHGRMLNATAAATTAETYRAASEGAARAKLATYALGIGGGLVVAGGLTLWLTAPDASLPTEPGFVVSMGGRF